MVVQISIKLSIFIDVLILCKPAFHCSLGKSEETTDVLNIGNQRSKNIRKGCICTRRVSPHTKLNMDLPHCMCWHLHPMTLGHLSLRACCQQVSFAPTTPYSLNPPKCQNAHCPPKCSLWSETCQSLLSLYSLPIMLRYTWVQRIVIVDVNEVWFTKWSLCVLWNTMQNRSKQP